jgi:hypothetical protein
MPVVQAGGSLLTARAHRFQPRALLYSRAGRPLVADEADDPSLVRHCTGVHILRSPRPLDATNPSRTGRQAGWYQFRVSVPGVSEPTWMRTSVGCHL